jgi:hypothetical protein
MERAFSFQPLGDGEEAAPEDQAADETEDDETAAGDDDEAAAAEDDEAAAVEDDEAAAVEDDDQSGAAAFSLMPFLLLASAAVL